MRPRRARAVRQIALKAFIWVFLVIFIFSVVGVAVVSFAPAR